MSENRTHNNFSAFQSWMGWPGANKVIRTRLDGFFFANFSAWNSTIENLHIFCSSLFDGNCKIIILWNVKSESTNTCSNLLILKCIRPKYFASCKCIRCTLWRCATRVVCSSDVRSLKIDNLAKRVKSKVSILSRSCYTLAHWFYFALSVVLKLLPNSHRYFKQVAQFCGVVPPV